MCHYSLSVHKAFVGILKETDDIAGQHEAIGEELQSKVYKELQNLHNEAKQERKKVGGKLVFDMTYNKIQLCQTASASMPTVVTLKQQEMIKAIVYPKNEGFIRDYFKVFRW